MIDDDDDTQGYLSAQPKREWVGLTDEEFQCIYDYGRTPSGMMEMVEAKLKEKNTSTKKTLWRTTSLEK